MLTRVKTKLHMQVVVREKMRNDLSNARQICAIRAEDVRKLEVEKEALEMDKKVLAREKAKLQQQIKAMSGQEGESHSVADWRKVAEFWSEVEAKTREKNALRTPELKS